MVKSTEDATHWITGRTADRVLELNPDGFLHCDLLPPLVDIDVTAAHTEQVACHCGRK